MAETVNEPCAPAAGPRERAYDEHFAPLVKRLVELSNEHQIPVLFVCELDAHEGGIVTPVTINADDAFPLQSVRACNAFDALEEGFEWLNAHVARLTEFYEAYVGIGAVKKKAAEGGFRGLDEHTNAVLAARARFEDAGKAIEQANALQKDG